MRSYGWRSRFDRIIITADDLDRMVPESRKPDFSSPASSGADGCLYLLRFRPYTSRLVAQPDPDFLVILFSCGNAARIMESPGRIHRPGVSLLGDRPDQVWFPPRISGGGHGRSGGRGCRRSGRWHGSSGGNRRPEPQGHGSLRPSFSVSSVSTPTMRLPRLTRVSLEGTPGGACWWAQKDISSRYMMGLPDSWATATDGRTQGARRRTIFLRMIEVGDGFGAEPVEFNGEDDHVHLLVH